MHLRRRQTLLFVLLTLVPVPLFTVGGLAVPFPELAQRALAPILSFVHVPAPAEVTAAGDASAVHTLAIRAPSGELVDTRHVAAAAKAREPQATPRAGGTAQASAAGRTSANAAPGPAGGAKVAPADSGTSSASAPGSTTGGLDGPATGAPSP
jgi:hypothetical protein